MSNSQVASVGNVRDLGFYNYERLFFYILFFYIFCYSNVIRLILGNILHVNLLYSILPSLLIVAFYLLKNKRVNYLLVYIGIYLALLYFISMVQYHISISASLRFITGLLIPLLLVGIRWNSPKKILKKFLQFYNWLITINVIYGLIDFILRKSLQLKLANLLANTHYFNSIHNDIKSGVYRLFSLLGHPLTNMLLLIIFIGINLCYNHYFREKVNLPLPIIYFVTLVGTLLCNSKFGILIISLILLSVILTQKNKFRNISFISIFLILLLSTETLRQNVIQRFLIAVERGDLTNGRMSALESLASSDSTMPSLFVGRGIGSSDLLLQSLSSLNNIEIPAIMYMYDYGILSTLLIYIVLFLIPVFTFIKNKHFYMLFIFLMIFMFANSYNGLATSIGIVQIFTFISMLLINISNFLKSELSIKN